MEALQLIDNALRLVRLVQDHVLLYYAAVELVAHQEVLSLLPLEQWMHDHLDDVTLVSDCFNEALIATLSEELRGSGSLVLVVRVLRAVRFDEDFDTCVGVPHGAGRSNSCSWSVVGGEVGAKLDEAVRSEC